MLKKLKIKLESVNYTQGAYDFVDTVDTVDAPNAQSMLAFSIWYAKKSYGRITSMPAFDAKALEAAIKRT